MPSYKSLMIPNTPWECYEIDGEFKVHVKRDDLCCNPPGPPYSKMRGLEIFLDKLDKGIPIGVQDAGYHSRSGWGAAFLCKPRGLPCYVFYPVKKADGGVDNHVVREYQVKARDLGATLIPMQATMASVLWYQAKNILEERTNGKGIMLPAGLRIKENALGTAIETRDFTPPELKCGTWLLSISSGTTGAGVMMGLKEFQHAIHFIAYLGSSKNVPKTYDYMCEIAGYEPDNLEIIDEGWNYADSEKEPMPFPSSPYYEAKTWYWMLDHLEELESPIVFWNIGD